jgi:hypothetical protein
MLKYKRFLLYLFLLFSLCLFTNKQLLAQQNYTKLEGFRTEKLKLLTQDSLSLLLASSLENDTLGKY